MVKLKTYNCIVFTDVSTHKFISILFKIRPASALFLKCSLNFANVSLDILIKYILIEEKKKSVV